MLSLRCEGFEKTCLGIFYEIFYSLSKPDQPPLQVHDRYKQGQSPTFFSSQSLQVATMANKQLVFFSFEAKAVVPFEKEAKPLASLPLDHLPLSLFPLSHPRSPPPPTESKQAIYA
jgi:hypothetical protein